ncbi:SDR family NAD(P)-dependent oxidoreductase [Synoicihabitans lomoniglobus]|uniref:SDR family NAD(P)-dependent oxidoreductase n=1 Tax=Synoicihabitans lomoniglobus TaxID=2909285 RepID=A0AAE9ZVN1_9BACT|nr:SDR family oxidoreductase [Opitutaceae bacterium LMO-M01]WED63685.1 SDR family NAD(P)-dependent oxidoreductase [Opitutaceae bacterium LMO-M01]
MNTKTQRVVVTGGATNIGRAITEAFLAAGARVAVGQPDPQVAAPLIARYGERVVVLPVDVGDAGQCRRFLDEAAAALGGIDALVNNAAITGPSSMSRLPEVTPEIFDRMMRVNVGGAVFCSQAAVPHLSASGGGVIVHISSINALRPQHGAMLYAATKAGVSSLAQSMGKELAPAGIRVVAVAPGDIRTADSNAMAAPTASHDVVGQTPLGPGEPNDIGEVVVYLCSRRAKFVTATTWVVDGGLMG